MIINNYTNKLEERFRERASFSSDELLSFFKEWEPDLKETTFRWRVYELKQRGFLQSVKRGFFTLRTKPVFELSVSDVGIKAYKRILKSYPHIRACVWNTQNLSKLMLHQPARSWDVLEVESDAFDLVWENVISDGIGLPINAHHHGSIEYVNANSSTPKYFIKKLLTRAPVQPVAGEEYVLPTLEKVLVDIFCEPDFFFTFAGSEYSVMLNNAYHHFAVDFAKLLQYSGRRNKAKELKDLMLTTTDIPPNLVA
ncbi:hypothetical protein HHL17_10345 [Chitinophaga sp. G-6-1-13]|uniref:Uncharacterized protein n=1 Tax=Chitinophaga fulva TaxID=2728842 RepID=A0A848GLL4_9BACT|nr:DUF6577 family protein [Chitinophaga fulva]NML37590.1 hypothetical protein [Chitinophaga fulva]